MSKIKCESIGNGLFCLLTFPPEDGVICSVFLQDESASQFLSELNNCKTEKQEQDLMEEYEGLAFCEDSEEDPDPFDDFDVDEYDEDNHYDW